VTARLGITGLLVLASAGALVAQAPRFGSRVDLVVVSAVVRDSQNTMVRGLAKNDFEVTEDGKPVAVSTFAEVNADNLAPQDDGRFVVLLMDDLATHPMYATRIKQVAHAFADRMGRRDVVSVIFINGGGSTATTSKAQVHAAIDKFKPFGTPPATMRAVAEHAIETIGDLSKQLVKLQHRRKVLVCIGPATHFNPALRAGELEGEVGEAMKATARADVTTYVIDPLGLTPELDKRTRPIEGMPLSPPDADPSGNVAQGAGITSGMDGFARETGGTAFANVNIFGPAVDQVWQESGTYYLLGYEPARRDNKRHTIEVRVKKPDMSARARRTR
jgi:VWFA-related protein